MDLLEIKQNITFSIDNYLNRFYKNHKGRAIELRRFIDNADSCFDICIRIINEHSLFNLGYSLINVNLNNTFEHSIKNRTLNGAYYSNIIVPAFDKILAIDFDNLSLGESFSSNYNKTLVFRKNSDFYNDLLAFLDLHNVYYKDLKEGDEWLRDTFFVGKEKIYVRTKANINVKSEQENLPCNINSRKIWSQGEFRNNLPESYLVTNKYLSLNNKFYDNKDFMTQHSDNRSLNGVVKENLAKDTIRPLEGGNLFEVVNCDGDKYYFIGINVLLNEIDFKNIKNGTMSDPKDLTHRDILNKCRLELERYKKIFKTQNVIALPQWSYHLDLQISYIGKATFLIHSFNEVLDKFNDICSDIDKSDQFSDIARDASEREIIIKYIDATLKSCGFKTIKFAGVLHDTYKDWDENGEEKIDYKPKYALGKGTISAFVNGIDLSLGAKQYYLTIDSPYINHKTYFTNLLREQNIEVVYLRVNGKSAKATLEHISARGGALRCQTNFIPFEYLSSF